MARLNVLFTKMHGNGNDFIIIDEIAGEVLAEGQKKDFAVWACHRRFGVGADGVIYVVAGRGGADVGMRLFQPDGSEPGMCGNGLRCMARFARDTGHASSPFSVWTPSSVLQVEITDEDGCIWVRADMGKPLFARKDIPAAGAGELLEQEIAGETISAVNTGVPHAVIFTDNHDFDVENRANPVRHDETFSQGVNVNFVMVKGGGLRIRTFERGIEAETLSCGTGAVASAAVARRLGITGDDVEVKTEGGLLRVMFEGDTAFMSGGAKYVFEGVAVWEDE